MDNSFIKLSRKIKLWEWYTDGNTVRLFLHLLLNANFKPSRYRGYDLPKGSLIIGRKQLALDLNLSERQIRTSLSKLTSTNELTIKTTNRFSICTIAKWADYQDKRPTKSPTDDQQATNKRPTSDQQMTTEEEGKNERRKEGKNRSGSINYDSFPALPKKQLLDDWLQVRKTKRAANTQTAIDGVGRELHKAVNAGYGVDACFQIMAEQSWAGFRFKWLENVQTDIVQSQSKNKQYAKPATWED